MGSVKSKLNSDRLWALVAFGGLVIANAQFSFGLEVIPEGAQASPLMLLAYAVIAFILGKSLRGSAGGSIAETIFERIVPGGTSLLAEKADPDA